MSYSPPRVRVWYNSLPCGDLLCLEAGARLSSGLSPTKVGRSVVDQISGHVGGCGPCPLYVYMWLVNLRRYIIRSLRHKYIRFRFSQWNWNGGQTRFQSRPFVSVLLLYKTWTRRWACRVVSCLAARADRDHERAKKKKVRWKLNVTSPPSMRITRTCLRHTHVPEEQQQQQQHTRMDGWMEIEMRVCGGLRGGG